MKTKDILLTFDFELFLGGRSGSVENCMIKPTNELMKIIKKHKLSTVFFVDTLYLSALKEQGKQNEKALIDYKVILNLLKSLIDHGSYIFHHIHPHWLDAKYLEEFNEWDVSDKTRFALNNLSASEIEKVFALSDEIISEIYEGKDKPPFFGYRAGGLYAQPFENYRNQMQKFNIKMDFSVLKNAKSTGGNGSYSFDYSVFPTEDIFKFSKDVVQKDDQGDFIEITMDQFKLKGFPKIINGLYYRRNFSKETWQRWGDGKSSGNILKSTKKANKFLSEETFSIELLNKYKASLYYNQVKEVDFVHLISHPKLFSSENLISFEKFISKTTKSFLVESDIYAILARKKMIG